MADDQTTTGFNPLMLLVWLWVGLPFAYGIYELFQKVSQLFGG
jgi:membrane protein insertase Oxa1/YidC/SpoIIIJ